MSLETNSYLIINNLQQIWLGRFFYSVTLSSDFAMTANKRLLTLSRLINRWINFVLSLQWRDTGNCDIIAFVYHMTVFMLTTDYTNIDQLLCHMVKFHYHSLISSKLCVFYYNRFYNGDLVEIVNTLCQR